MHVTRPTRRSITFAMLATAGVLVWSCGSDGAGPAADTTSSGQRDGSGSSGRSPNPTATSGRTGGAGGTGVSGARDVAGGSGTRDAGASGASGRPTASSGASTSGSTGMRDAGTGSSGRSGAATSGADADATHGSTSPFPAGVTKPRIMIVGDSISAGPGCYKKYLLKNLQTNHYSQFEFVGQYDDDCGGGVRHSAVSCSNTKQFTHPTFTMSNCSVGKEFPGMSTLVKTHKPDMIMLQLGVNDVWGGNTPVDSVLTNYEELIQQARAENPHVVMVVAQIHKIITDNCKNEASTRNAQALVEAVPAWAKKVDTAESPVFVADLWTNSDPKEAADCVHPDDPGAQRMGLNWYNALKGILTPDQP